MNTQNVLILVIALLIIGGGIFLFLQQSSDSVVVVDEAPEEPVPVEPDEGIGDGAEPLPEEPGTEEPERGDETVLTTTPGGNAITAYHYGTGETELLFVGGAHGGYSWNTALVAYELIDWLDANPDAVPENVTVSVIPVLNPDGLEATVGTAGRFEPNAALAVAESTRVDGRFNGNAVDLNRNFACDWSAEGTWRDRTVSGGSAPFSEPEAAALRDYVLGNNIDSAVVWFSAEGKVYPSACGNEPSDASFTLAETFGTAADYPVNADEDFSAYAVTGDMVNWMASENVTAISVLLSDHQSVEWDQNQAGVEAVLNAYAQ